MRRERRLVFGEVAEQYDRVRPRYPSALVDDVVALAGGAGSQVRVLDVGCGTGKAAVMLAERGATGVALEPDPAMAAVARERLSAHRGWRVDEGRFETFDARAASPGGDGFDLVTCAQAWHWVEPGVRFGRARAALRDGGWLALWWNVATTIPDAALRADLDVAYARHAPDLADRWTGGDARPPPMDDLGGAGLGAPIERSYPWSLTYGAAAYAELLETHSDHRMLDPAVRAALLADVSAAIERRGGAVEVPYVAVLWAARRD